MQYDITSKTFKQPLTLNTIEYKLPLSALKPKRHPEQLPKRHSNILLSWVHNYMKTQKQIAKRNNWEKYTPLAKKDKKVGFAILFYI